MTAPAPSSRVRGAPSCDHGALAPGARCGGCGFVVPKPTASERVARAWQRHTLTAFFAHRRRLTFVRQLHAFLKAGVGLPTAFADLAKYAGADDRRALMLAAKRIERGERLGDALRETTLLDAVGQELLAAGEESGRLQAMLEKLLVQLEGAQQMRWKAVLSALYPTYLVLLFVFLGPLLDLSGAVSCGASLGAAYVAGLLRNLLIFGTFLAAIICTPLVAAALDREAQWDRVRRRLPLLGAVHGHLRAARFCVGLSSALAAGLEASRCLSLAVRTAASPDVSSREEAMHAAVRSGGTFADAIAASGVFDGADLGQLAIGERTGELDSIADRLGQEHWEGAVRSMRTATLVALGLVVALMLWLILTKLLGVLLGPVKSYYDAMGKEPPRDIP